jgi:hypothetical protein
MWVLPLLFLMFLYTLIQVTTWTLASFRRGIIVLTEF